MPGTRPLLLAALAACFLGAARAEERPPGAPAETPPPAGERKAAARGGERREAGARTPKQKDQSQPAPDKQKPCEVVRPCPID